MRKYNGFRIEFWESLGFRFRYEKLYEGREAWWGSACFGPYSFTLRISEITVASVNNDLIDHHERHAVL